MGGRGHTGALPRLAQSPSRSNGRALASAPPGTWPPYRKASPPPAFGGAVARHICRAASVSERLAQSPLPLQWPLAAPCQPPTLARLEGFEPPTRGLGGRCSVQLSYRRKRRD